MSMEKTAVIVGTGFMGRVHARAVRSAGHQVVGFVGSSLSKAGEIAGDYPGALAFESVEAALSELNPDVVHVCTPNNLHLEHSLMAIEAGAHVVCEKPLATNSQDAKRLVDEARRARVIGVVPFVYRFYPAVQEIRHRVHSREAGDVHLLHGSYLQDWLAGSGESNWRVDPSRGGQSRAFADIGVHWCDLVEHVSGHRITRLVASASQAYPHRQGVPVTTEDAMSVVFETDLGAGGSLIVSQVSPGRKNRIWLEVDGKDASFTFDHDAPNSLLIGGLAANTQLDTGWESLTSETARKLQVVPSGHPQGYVDAFVNLMSAAYQSFDCDSAIEGLPTFDDGFRAVALTEAVMRSAVDREWIDVASDEFVSAIQ
jgi:predicted dehydrogenase